MKYKRIVTIADDFAYGHECAPASSAAFRGQRRQIIQKIFTPLATPD